MLSLNKDLFARFVISAQKDRSLNSSFKISHVDTWDKYSVDYNKVDDEKKLIDGAFKEKLDNIQKIKSEPIVSSNNLNISSKLENTMRTTIDNPHLNQIKAELEFAEALLKKIKLIDEHNIKIPIIEDTISRLKMQLEQKSYV
ncbi:MAG: hypothetical protein ACP5N1_06120 [Candidatus Woesearchaeota archaeon]